MLAFTCGHVHRGRQELPAHAPVVAALSALLHHLLTTNAMAVLVSCERLVVRCRRCHKRVCAPVSATLLCPAMTSKQHDPR